MMRRVTQINGRLREDAARLIDANNASRGADYAAGGDGPAACGAGNAASGAGHGAGGEGHAACGAGHAAGGAGHGELDVQVVQGTSRVICAMAQSPLRLLTPTRPLDAITTVYTSTFGGGLLAGDSVALKVNVGSGASAALLTQASTKVYRRTGAASARQTLSLAVAENATCIVMPDPVTCFAGSAFESRIDARLHGSASLVLLDWFTSGRRARGERWAFERYVSKIDVAIGDRRIFRESLRLDQADGPIDSPFRMGRCDCWAVILLLGPRLAVACGNAKQAIDAQAVVAGATLLFSISPIPGGAVIRVAGPATEVVGRWIRQQLSFLPSLIGNDPWLRKW